MYIKIKLEYYMLVIKIDLYLECNFLYFFLFYWFEIDFRILKNVGNVLYVYLGLLMVIGLLFIVIIVKYIVIWWLL